MSLTRQSVRICLVWKNLGQKLGSTGGRKLWQAFYACLDELAQRSGSADGENATTEQSIRGFLATLLDHATNDAAATQLRRSVAGDSVFDLLERWQHVEEASRAVDSLFERPLDRFAAHFYLGQLAFVLGQLRVAKQYALDAFLSLREAMEAQGRSKSLALRILEFLTVTLVIEVDLCAEGYDPIKEPRLQPQVDRVLKALSRKKRHFLEGFATAADWQLLGRAASRPDSRASSGSSGVPERAEELRKFLEEFWSPIPPKHDPQGEASPQGLAAGEPGPLALAFELSRKNAVGMFLFHDRKWQKARDTFNAVRDRIEELDRDKHWHSSLTPLKQEAQVFIARLQTQECKFGEAEVLLLQALDYYRAAHDLFAENKTRKYLAELKYRQLDWDAAEQLFVEVLYQSRAQGFDHDAAVAEMYLGRIYSRFGFQRRALRHFALANEHFEKYDVSRENIDSIFWQAVAHSRARDLVGHPVAHVADMRAKVRIYEALFIGVQGSLPSHLVGLQGVKEKREALRRSISHERHPDLLQVMVDLRLGTPPQPERIEALRKLVEGCNDPQASWRELAQAYLCQQVVRLIQLSGRCFRRSPSRPVASRRTGTGRSARAAQVLRTRRLHRDARGGDLQEVLAAPRGLRAGAGDF